MEGIWFNELEFGEKDLQPVSYTVQCDSPQFSAAYAGMSYEQSFYKAVTKRSVKEFMQTGGKWFSGDYRGTEVVLWLSPESKLVPDSSYKKITKKEAITLICQGYCVCSNC